MKDPFLIISVLCYCECLRFSDGSPSSLSNIKIGSVSDSNLGHQAHPLSLGKPCSGKSMDDCLFKLDHLLSHHEVYFSCQNNECVCKSPVPSGRHQEAFLWDLTSASENLACKIQEYGPCGEANNLQIECHGGFLCVGSRCRDPRKLGRSSLGSKCYDTVDCASGFECRVNDTLKYWRNFPGPAPEKICMGIQPFSPTKVTPLRVTPYNSQAVPIPRSTIKRTEQEATPARASTRKDEVANVLDIKIRPTAPSDEPHPQAYPSDFKNTPALNGTWRATPKSSQRDYPTHNLFIRKVPTNSQSTLSTSSEAQVFLLFLLASIGSKGYKIIPVLTFLFPFLI